MSDIKLTTGIQTYRFFDEDDNLIAQFRINPMDVNLADRAMEVADWFEGAKTDMENGTVHDLSLFNKVLEDKIAYVLGYEPSDIFGVITATTVLPNGDMWAAIILDKIITEIEPQVKKRTKAMEKAQEKYLRKYEPK